MISLASLVVPETANVGLSFALLFYFNSHNFDLIISKADLNLEHGGHDKFIGFD
jgi:hypothetical protein